MENNLTPDAGLGALVRYFEEAEQASQDARQEAEQARDYYDGNQWTEAERKALAKRKQPIVWDNLIRRKVDYLRGLERQSRTDPKAYPRTMTHEQDAEVATDALRYVKADQDIDVKKSAVFENLMVEGFGGVEVVVQNARGGFIDPKVIHIPWERTFFDPHSSALDFSDARYLGFVTWMDADEAKGRWQGKEAVIDAALTQPHSTYSQTYDDKPKWSYWSDAKRRRVRVVTMYYKAGQTWMRCEFTVSGHLTDPAPSPFLDEDGKPECALILQACYRDRDNDPYGLVRDMIPLQDEVNKRRSKFLHMVTMRQTRVARALGGVKEELRRELARPDGVVVADAGEFDVLPNGDQATGQFQLLMDTKQALSAQGPNATMQGKQGADQSGRAILALQQGGMVEMTPLLDALRHFSLRMYRQIWNRIRQYWTSERWVRVTDDERGVRFAAINTTQGKLAMLKVRDALDAGQIDEQTAEGYGQQIMADPAMGQPANVIAELDVDIDIDEVNETPTLAAEEFQSLVQLAAAQPGLIPPDVLIEASSLRSKQKILDRMKEAQSQQGAPNPMQELQIADAQAKIEKTQSETAKNMAQASGHEVNALAKLHSPLPSVMPERQAFAA